MSVENNQTTQENTSNEAGTQEGTVETQQAQTQETVAETTQGVSSVSSELEISKQKEEEVGEQPLQFGAEFDKLVAAGIKGELSEEQMASIEKSGLGKHFNALVAGYQAQQQATDKQIYDVVGSKEAYSEMIEWAKSNLSEQEVASYNNAVLKSGDIGVAKLAVEGLKARYTQINGSAPQKVIQGGGTSNESNRPYSDVQQFINDTRKPEYYTNPEFKKQVDMKRAASGF